MSIEHRNFDLAAQHWDERPQRVQLAQEITDALLKKIPETSSLDVLDVGCGTGLITMQLQPLVHSITGVDSSTGMLDVLNNKISNLKLANARTFEYDFNQGKKLPGKYDLIVSSMTLHHIEEVHKVLEQLFELLVPGGKICIADLDTEGGRFHGDNTGVFHFGFDRDKLIDIVSQVGFTSIVIETAAHVIKPDTQQVDARFSVFLLTAIKGESSS